MADDESNQDDGTEDEETGGVDTEISSNLAPASTNTIDLIYQARRYVSPLPPSSLPSAPAASSSLKRRSGLIEGAALATHQSQTAFAYDVPPKATKLHRTVGAEYSDPHHQQLHPINRGNF